MRRDRFASFTWSTLDEPSGGESFDDLCARHDALKPTLPLFDDRSDIAGELLKLHHRVIAALAGPVGESLFTIGRTLNYDDANARGWAGLVCRSPSSIDASLAYASAEARGLLLDHHAAVLALAGALLDRRTLDGAEVAEIVAGRLPAP